VTIDRHKYIVFKREDFFQMMGRFLPGGDVDCAVVAEEMIEHADKVSLEDAVVIRKQDYFASSALYAYASAVGTLADIADEHTTLPTEEIVRLRDLSEYFAGEAMHAVNLKHRQVPT
jgi:hypothetical protein